MDPLHPAAQRPKTKGPDHRQRARIFFPCPPRSSVNSVLKAAANRRTVLEAEPAADQSDNTAG